MHRLMTGLLAIVVMAGATGCAVNLSKRSPWDIQQIEALKGQLEETEGLAELQAGEAEEMRRAQAALQERLGSSATIGFDERGLVTRLVDTVLFDAGKAVLRRSAYPVLDKVAKVLVDVSEQPVGIEGHTDNAPIEISGWANNQELSVARANSVMEYLVEKHGITSSRLIPIGYGEDHPIVANDTTEGKQQNRRVEIVILPQASGKSYEAESKRVLQGRSRYSK